MPTPTYPSLTSIYPTEYSEQPPHYLGTKTEYTDGGIDTRSYSDTPLRRWTIIYEGKPTADATPFDALAAAVKYNPQEGSLLPLMFTPRGESATSVYIDEGGFKHTNSGSWIHRIEIHLIKRP